MLSAGRGMHADLAHGVQMFLGAFNGNRFFADSNRRMNVNARVRKVFDRVPLAAGVSAQIGRQLLPDGVTGNDHENLIGTDVQWAWRRLGVRAEFVTGNRPSTLLDLEPDFAPAFQPGARSTGGAVFSSVRLTGTDQIYGRYDQFAGDPVCARMLDVESERFDELTDADRDALRGVILDEGVVDDLERAAW